MSIDTKVSKLADIEQAYERCKESFRKLNRSINDITELIDGTSVKAGSVIEVLEDYRKEYNVEQRSRLNVLYEEMSIARKECGINKLKEGYIARCTFSEAVSVTSAPVETEDEAKLLLATMLTNDYHLGRPKHGTVEKVYYTERPVHAKQW